MATYAELYSLGSNSDLRNKIAVAVTIKAKDYIALASPTADQLKWSAKALLAPVAEAEKLLPYVLAANSTLTVAQITGAADSAIQSGVAAAVDKLVAGGIV